MNKNKIFKTLFAVLFLAFLVGYIIERTGYYEYNLQNKTIMTSEAMTRFEQDLEEGKDVTLENYIVTTNKDYTSTLTRNTNKVSKEVNKYLKKAVEETFKILGRLVAE